MIEAGGGRAATVTMTLRRAQCKPQASLPVKRVPAVVLAVLALLLALVGQAGQAQRALLIFDPDDGDVLRAENANRPSHPASLVKLMTIYLVLQAVDSGKLSMSQMIKVSKAAASQAPKRLGLRPGSSIGVEVALLALIVTSANDVAVIAAEAVSGTEAAFADLMNATAVRLGMRRSHFRNASGLPHSAQITTAADLAILVRALYRDFPDHIGLFARSSYRFRGRTRRGHNNFLGAYQGGTGLKTGFTCRAGFNLVASASRKGQRLVGIVLGEKSAGRRDARMIRYMNAAYAGESAPGDSLSLAKLPTAPDQGHGDVVNGRFLADECINPTRSRNLHRAQGWSLLFGFEREKAQAVKRARAFARANRKTLRGGRPLLVPQWAQSVIYRVGLTGLRQTAATATCLSARKNGRFCVVLPPQTAKSMLQRALKILRRLGKQAG